MKEIICFRKEYYGQMKLKLSFPFIIIEIMCGEKMEKPTHQITRYQLWQYKDLRMFLANDLGKISMIWQ